jgi:hypothetical protein
MRCSSGRRRGGSRRRKDVVVLQVKQRDTAPVSDVSDRHQRTHTFHHTCVGNERRGVRARV